MYYKKKREFSAAKLEYSLYLYQGWPEKIAGEYVKRIRGESTEEKMEKEHIKILSSPEEIEKWMRKGLSSSANKQAVRDKALEHEDEMEERIKRRSLRSFQDGFIENALYFFLHSKKNHWEWILDNLDNFKSPYARSMFALVVGFRGDLPAIETMMQEADYFEKNYPDHESYDQGPILAVQELSVRFLNDSFDAVIIANALHVMPDPEKAMEEIHRVLRSRGVLIAPNFVNHGKGFVSKMWSGILKAAGISFDHQWSAEEYLTFLEDHGWKVVNHKLLKARIPMLYTECVEK